MKFYFKKSLGQHFLKNEEILKKIISINQIKNKLVVEVGPGQGALTKLILDENPKKLFVIEKDKNLTPYLIKIKEKHPGKFFIITDDVLKIDFRKFNCKKISIIANLPYNIASTLIIKLIRYFDIIDSMVLMVQKEVADRLSADVSSSAYGRLSVLIQLHALVKKKFDVDAKNFYPKPKVQSSVILIQPKESKYFVYENLDKILKVSFKQRRKTLKNNLKILYFDAEKKILNCGVNPNLRPQDIKPSDYVKLSNYLI